MKSSTETLITAMRILARDIQSNDGVANSAINEAANEIERQAERIAELEQAQLKKLTFSDYEKIVDINNHNYGRYEDLVDGGYIIGNLGDSE